MSGLPCGPRDTGVDESNLTDEVEYNTTDR